MAIKYGSDAGRAFKAKPDQKVSSVNSVKGLRGFLGRIGSKLKGSGSNMSPSSNAPKKSFW